MLYVLFYEVEEGEEEEQEQEQEHGKECGWVVPELKERGTNDGGGGWGGQGDTEGDGCAAADGGLIYRILY